MGEGSNEMDEGRIGSEVEGRDRMGWMREGLGWMREGLDQR